MTKQELLKELSENTWVMLKPSQVDGIGVFAIRTIPAGTKGLFSSGFGKWIDVPRHDVEQLPGYAKRLVENFCLYDHKNYYIADYGFKIMDLINFINHDDNPNLISINDGEDFETLRTIQEGEELFLDYGTIVETDE